MKVLHVSFHSHRTTGIKYGKTPPPRRGLCPCWWSRSHVLSGPAVLIHSGTKSNTSDYNKLGARPLFLWHITFKKKEEDQSSGEKRLLIHSEEQILPAFFLFIYKKGFKKWQTKTRRLQNNSTHKYVTCAIHQKHQNTTVTAGRDTFK